MKSLYAQFRNQTAPVQKPVFTGSCGSPEITKNAPAIIVTGAYSLR